MAFGGVRRGVSRFVKQYEYYNKRNPIIVRGTAGMGLFFIGDVIAQRMQPRDSIEWQWKDWDYHRTASATTWRALVWAPLAHYFWIVLESSVTPRVAHLGFLRGTMLKVLFDFMTVSPVSIGSFNIWMKWFETFDHEATSDHARKRPRAHLPTLVDLASFKKILFFLCAYSSIPNSAH